MGRYRIVVFLVILLVWTQPVSPSASAPVHTDAGDSGPLHVETTTESGLTTPDNTDVVVDARGTGDAHGLASNARYYFGDPATPIDRPAFTVTNTDTTAHDVTISYTGVTDDNAVANVQFRIHDDTGYQLGVVTEEAGTTTIHGLSGGATLYVIVIVDTHGLAPADDLSGTLTLHA